MPLKPLCFVVMPFGQKPDPGGRADIDFDKIYNTAIKPGVEEGGMEPIRADEERTGGIIHKPMFERLLLCDYVLADLTAANPNVFYELGVRHTARPATTLTIFAKHQIIPFDVNFLRSMPYDLGEDNVFGDTESRELREAISARLKELRGLAINEAPIDSPFFQLVSDWKPTDIARIKTDVFRDQVQLNENLKHRLLAIREKGKNKDQRDEAIQEFQKLRHELVDFDAADAGTIIDLFLSHRALEDWDGMISLHDSMPKVLKRQILVREQLGFAYNRRAGKTKNAADRAQALRILEEVEDQQGPSSETCGLIGRIHKDNFKEALEKGESEFVVRGHLNKSIEAYLRGYMADLRDAFPGINAVTLLDIRGDEDSMKKKDQLLPVVRFAVERRLGENPDYWDHATMLELAVLENDSESAKGHLANALAVVRETWEPKTTANNLRMIEGARKKRGIDTSWLLKVIDALEG
jgi:hypothetical protein